MQSEEFDKKIVEAAEHHHPVYNDMAWVEMEKLLDKHLPQKKEKKRRFLFWFLLPLLIGGAGLFIVRPWQKNNSIANNLSADKNNQKPAVDVIGAERTEPNDVVEKEVVSKTENEIVTDNNNKDKTDKTEGGSVSTTTSNIPIETVSTANRKEENKFTATTSIAKTKKSKRNINAGNIKQKQSSAVRNDKVVLQTNKLNTTENKEKNIGEPIAKQEVKSDNNVSNEKKISEVDISSIFLATESKPDTIQIVIPEITIPEEIEKVVTIEKSEQSDSINSKVASNKKNKPANYLFAGVSFGGDVSFVNGNKAGSSKTVIGFGVGYNFKNKITIRTGFYTGRKIYSATADSYNPPAAFTQLYPYLEKVDADCKVYEIPVSVSLHFGKNPAKSWFASAGLSSFLMKKETYNYFYKYTPTGTTYTQEWTIKDENKHYFSVATISAGYQRSIGKRMIFIAEPYVKLPLGGVGFGKVKLNSAGVLFTVGIKPFNK